MKRVVISLVTAVCLISGAIWVYWHGRGRAVAPGEIPEPVPAVLSLQEQAEDMQGDLDRMRKRVADLESSAASDRLAQARVRLGPDAGQTATSSGETDENAPAKAAPGGLQPETLAEEERRNDILDEALARLFEEEPTWDDVAGVFKTLHKEGLMDEALAEYEKRAQESPENPDVQAELGNAYIQKLFYANDLEKGVLSRKADKAYDRALELNDQHWDARFSKAMAYSFAPPIFGLQKKAIDHFEILVNQQETRVAEEKFSQTYLLLGNLYANQGKAKKAQEVWGRGLARHPSSKDLSQQVHAAK